VELSKSRQHHQNGTFNAEQSGGNIFFAQSVIQSCLHIIRDGGREKGFNEVDSSVKLTPDGHPVARTRRKSDVFHRKLSPYPQKHHFNKADDTFSP